MKAGLHQEHASPPSSKQPQAPSPILPTPVATPSSVAESTQKSTNANVNSRIVPTPKKLSGPAAEAPAVSPKKAGLNYSKFANIEDSDDEKLVPSKQDTVMLPMGMPREMVSQRDYNKVWQTLLKQKDLPFTPAPDLDLMWGYYKHGGMDEQALLDQACEYLGKFPCRLDEQEWKAKTYSLTKKLEKESREDEARMWSIICICRFPKDPDAYYNQGVILNKMCDKAKFSGAPTMRLPSLDGTPPKAMPTEQYCALFTRAAVSYYRRCLKVEAKQRPAYINLIGCLERNEPAGWYDDVHTLAAAAVRNGIWYNKWQRPPHFVPTLLCKSWHNPEDFEMCRQLHTHYPTIRKEYDAYMEKLTNRKDWDDSDKTPGLGDVGGREGAIHDGGLTKSGSWREVPIVANGKINKEYAELFPETTKILTTHCRDAVGLALCGGGDVIFSVLTPGTRLRAHCGPSNSRLTCHLGIHVPKTVEQGLKIRVAADAWRGWEEGRCVVFDDSCEHEVIYEEASPDEAYPGDRVVLLANFWHPDFEFKNDPEWREKSDKMMASIEVESLPQVAIMKAENSSVAV